MERSLRVGTPKKAAAGLPGVAHAMDFAIREGALLPLLKVNQTDGFDCPGCAWPDPERRHVAEFCENGVKAVAEETTARRCGPEFFAAHPIPDLRGQTDHWLGRQGRLTTPMYLREGSAVYEPVTWEFALDLLADTLRSIAPEEAVFYTSGRTSNEAAFLYQLLARRLGTNNLPDCSNMCHESSGSALTETIGIGKGTVYNEYEFIGHGLRSTDSRERMEEAVDLIERAWREAPLTYDGRFHQVHVPAIRPRPNGPGPVMT